MSVCAPPVFLCAVLPEIGTTLIQQVENEEVPSTTCDDRSGARPEAIKTEEAHAPRLLSMPSVPHRTMSTPMGDLRLRSCRPQANQPLTVFTPLRRWPDVPSSYILGQRYRSVRPE